MDQHLVQRDDFHSHMLSKPRGLRWVLLVHCLSKELQVRLRLAHFHPGLQASNDGQHHPSRGVRRKYFVIERERGPDIRSGITKAGRHHSDHGMRGTV